MHTTKGLVVAGGALNVNSSKTGLKGKDYVDIQGGTLRIEAAKDAIKATNTDKQGLGWARVAGGDTVLRAGDDGIKALRTLEVLDGKLTVEESEEGLEGQYVNIHGGDTLINSKNDGVNASLSCLTIKSMKIRRKTATSRMPALVSPWVVPAIPQRLLIP